MYSSLPNQIKNCMNNKLKLLTNLALILLIGFGTAYYYKDFLKVEQTTSGMFIINKGKLYSVTEVTIEDLNNTTISPLTDRHSGE